MIAMYSSAVLVLVPWAVDRHLDSRQIVKREVCQANHDGAELGVIAEHQVATSIVLYAYHYPLTCLNLLYDGLAAQVVVYYEPVIIYHGEFEEHEVHASRVVCSAPGHSLVHILAQALQLEGLEWREEVLDDHERAQLTQDRVFVQEEEFGFVHCDVYKC